MSEEVSRAEIMSELARLRAMTETQFIGLNARVEKLENTQQTLVNVAVQGKTGLRVFLWLGGFLTAAAALAVAVWDRVFG